MKISSIKFVMFLFMAVTAIKTYAQYDPNKVPKKAQQIQEQAYQAAMNGEYDNSLKLLGDALKVYPEYVDAYLSRGGVFSSLKNYEAAVADFKKGFSMDSAYSSTFLLPYSIALAGNGQFEKALAKVNDFLKTPNLNQQSIKAGEYRKASYELALQNQTENYRYKLQNMGNAINGTHLEYFPSFTIDGSKIIFTRRINQDEDFFESEWKNGEWSVAKPVAGRINTQYNEGAQTLSQDGNWLIFAGCNYPEGAGSCDLYISYKTKNGTWTEPENLGPNINTEFWESSPSLSPDKNELFFASNRPGGFGGRDIYVSNRNSNGRWGKPINLGPAINTKGDDGCPFIHADNQTLYFNSNGHAGFGLTDLFVTKRTAENGWSAPKNMGYPINTIDDEGSLIVASDGKTGYFASDGKDTKGGLDIYSIELKEDLRAAKTLWVKGKVYDKVTGKGLPSLVELTELESNTDFSNIQTDEEGNYLVTLPQGKDFGFFVNRKGYLYFSENFSLKERGLDSAVTLNIPLQPISAGANVLLKNIFFETNKADLKPESQAELDMVARLLADNPKLVIEIGGHTDNIGTPKDNLELSTKRAGAVVKYLIDQKIPVARLKSKGFGETKPMAANSDEKGRAQNRRTELKVISN